MAYQRREVPQPIQVLSWRAGFMCHAEKLKLRKQKAENGATGTNAERLKG
jgi:hypothetical protein